MNVKLDWLAGAGIAAGMCSEREQPALGCHPCTMCCTLRLARGARCFPPGRHPTTDKRTNPSCLRAKIMRGEFLRAIRKLTTVTTLQNDGQQPAQQPSSQQHVRQPLHDASATHDGHTHKHTVVERERAANLSTGHERWSEIDAPLETLRSLCLSLVTLEFAERPRRHLRTTRRAPPAKLVDQHL
jgi:hypothetical protein